MNTRWRSAHAWSAGIIALALIGLTTTAAPRPTVAPHLTIALGRTPAPSQTMVTALAMDQGTGIAFVASGPFDSERGGATGPGTLTVLDTRHGAMRSLRGVRVGFGPSTVVVDERAERVLVLNTGGGDQYAGFVGGSVSVLDLRALEARAPGATITARTTPLGRQLPRALDIDRATGHAFVATWTLPATGVITHMVGGGVSMLDTHTGALLHTTQVGIAAETVAVDEAAGHAFALPGLQGPGATLSMLDTRTGALLRAMPVGTTARALAVDARAGRLFLEAASRTRGQLQARRTSDGSVVATTPVTDAVTAFAVDARRSRVFVQGGFENPSAEHGAVSVLDARDGALLATAPVGLSSPFIQILIGGVAQTMAVDDVTGHVFVASTATSGARGARTPRGVVSVLEARGRGLRALRTTALRGLPVALVADAVSGRAIVATMGMARPGPSTAGVSLLDGRTGALIGTVSLEGRI